MSELIEKQLNKMYEHFEKLNKRKNNMIQEDVKQVVKFVTQKQIQLTFGTLPKMRQLRQLMNT